MFYCRKMWTYMFCVHNMGYNKLIFYNCHEEQTNCAPDKVCSFVYHFINSLLLNIDELHVVVKIVTNNIGMVTFHDCDHRSLYLLSNLFSNISYSYIPCDQDSAMEKKVVIHNDKMYIPNECNGIISTTKHTASL